MNLRYLILVLFTCAGLQVLAQDKIYFKDGHTVNGKIVSIGEKTLTYRNAVADSSNADVLHTVPKSEIVLAEYNNGSVFIFGSQDANANTTQVDYNETREQRKARKMKEWKDYEATLSDNILGFYPAELAVGRLTASYERLLVDKAIGIRIPASLTYNLFTPTSTDSATATYNYRKGVSYITGLDIDFYTDLKPGLKYSVGPRFRYGTDMTLGGITGYTGQIENGIFRSKGDRFVSSLSVGFGFFKPTENNFGYYAKQVYPWASINWRLGFRL